jgi:hypothetical protein
MILFRSTISSARMKCRSGFFINDLLVRIHHRDDFREPALPHGSLNFHFWVVQYLTSGGAPTMILLRSTISSARMRYRRFMPSTITTLLRVQGSGFRVQGSGFRV